MDNGSSDKERRFPWLEWNEPASDRTPVHTPPEVESEQEISKSEEPEPGFEDNADTIFDGDQATVAYNDEEVPDHVAEFLDESAPSAERIVAPPEAPASPGALASASAPLPSTEDRQLDQVPRNIFLPLLLPLALLIGIAAALVYLILTA